MPRGLPWEGRKVEWFTRAISAEETLGWSKTSGWRETFISGIDVRMYRQLRTMVWRAVGKLSFLMYAPQTGGIELNAVNALVVKTTGATKVAEYFFLVRDA